MMQTLKIEIRNPKAKRLLQELETLNLISIKKEGNEKALFKKLLSKLRSQLAKPTLDQITNEVEVVRSKRYDK